MTSIITFAIGALAGFGIGIIAARFATQRYRTAMQGYHDELTQAQNRIHRALAQVTPGANATVSRMARLLCGRQA